MAPLSLLATLLLLASPVDSGEGVVAEHAGGRELSVYVPARLPPRGKRSLVVVLHGGLGNAQRIVTRQSERGLNLDAVAKEAGFLVAYLNGTPASPVLREDMLAWNAGRCCGRPAREGVDDVRAVKAAVDLLVERYGVDPRSVYGLGHSNGAMMALRLVCETDVLAAAVSIAGPLMADVEQCPAAKGKRVLAIHGADDQNVPVAGGQGVKGLSRAIFRSEADSRDILTRSGASYALKLIPGADHFLDHIDEAVERTDHQTLAQESARFFGLLK